MYDAIVVGAGPSGSATAAVAARAGARVLLLDKARFPRYKTCGGGIDGTTYRALRAIDVDPEVVVEAECREVTITYLGRGPTTYQLPDPLARMTMRTDLDHLLVRTAVERGAEFRDGVSIREIRVERDRVTVATDRGTESARYLAGADGVYSPIAKQFALNRRPHVYVANELELEPGADRQAEWRGRLLIDLSVWPLGYGWVFPKARHLSVGVGLPRVCARQVKGLVDRLRRRLDLSGGRVISHRSHMLGFRQPGEPVVRGRVLVAGDAAGLVDPNTGAGIGWAIQSGTIAGRTLAAAAQGTERDLRAYQTAIEQTFDREIRCARIMRNALMARLICFGHRVTGDRAFWRPIFAAIRGELSYTDWFRQTPSARWFAWTHLVPL